MKTEEGQGKELIELLKLQIGNYQQALNLEEELVNIISESRFSEIQQNTEAKNALMSSVNEVYSKLLPLADHQRNDDNVLGNSEAEKLRQQALSLLEKISTLQEQNLSKIVNSRKNMVDRFAVARKAKQVARGYKRTKSIYRSKFDTKS